MPVLFLNFAGETLGEGAVAHDCFAAFIRLGNSPHETSDAFLKESSAKGSADVRGKAFIHGTTVCTSAPGSQASPDSARTGARMYICEEMNI